jgi:hypothetical protein
MLHRSPHARHRRTGQRARRASAPTLATVRPPGSSERTRAGGPRGCSPASPPHANSQACLAHRVRRKRQWPSVQRDRAARSIGPDSALSVHQKRSVYSCRPGGRITPEAVTRARLLLRWTSRRVAVIASEPISADRLRAALGAGTGHAEIMVVPPTARTQSSSCPSANNDSGVGASSRPFAGRDHGRWRAAGRARAPRPQSRGRTRADGRLSQRRRSRSARRRQVRRRRWRRGWRPPR